MWHMYVAHVCLTHMCHMCHLPFLRAHIHTPCHTPSPFLWCDLCLCCACLQEHEGDLGGPRPRVGAEPEPEEEDSDGEGSGQIIRWATQDVWFFSGLQLLVCVVFSWRFRLAGVKLSNLVNQCRAPDFTVFDLSPHSPLRPSRAPLLPPQRPGAADDAAGPQPRRLQRHVSAAQRGHPWAWLLAGARRAPPTPVCCCISGRVGPLPMTAMQGPQASP